MGLIAKGKNSTEGWGMGFFLVFFPEEEEDEAAIINNSNNTSSSSSRKKKAQTISVVNTLLKRTNSNQILTKAQSTISICALLIFLTLLLFTLSTFEPNSSPQFINSRRHLSSNFGKNKEIYDHSLQGLGTLYTRGTRAMADLVICHVPESVSVRELQLFLRLFHRSNLPTKSDLLFIFPATSTASFDAVIREETESFFKLVQKLQEMGSGNTSVDSAVSFDVTQLVKSSKKEVERAETLWGRKIRSNISETGESELIRPSYGSVVSFDVGELDPENSLSGFLDHVPMSLRRWACYPMLLGRVKKYFKHIMLVDVKEVLLLGDPLGRVRSKSPESVHLSALPSKHGRKNSDRNHQKPVNPAIIMGGGRGIRRLSAAMLPEIVRATTATQHKRKSPVTESVLLNQLVGNEYVLKKINLVTSTESVPEVSSLSGLRPGHRMGLLNHKVIRRVNSNIDIDGIIMKHICSFSLDSSVYSDC